VTTATTKKVVYLDKDNFISTKCVLTLY